MRDLSKAIKMQERDKVRERTMDGIELKHCPFCGGSAGFLSVWAPKYEEAHDNRWRVKCRGECGNCGEVKIGKFAAAEAWNRRTPLPADNGRAE